MVNAVSSTLMDADPSVVQVAVGMVADCAVLDGSVHAMVPDTVAADDDEWQSSAAVTRKSDDVCGVVMVVAVIAATCDVSLTGIGIAGAIGSECDEEMYWYIWLMQV